MYWVKPRNTSCMLYRFWNILTMNQMSLHGLLDVLHCQSYPDHCAQFATVYFLLRGGIKITKRLDSLAEHVLERDSPFLFHNDFHLGRHHRLHLICQVWILA